ncbi:histidine kinase [Desulfovibrio sp. OttesenSCG-928-F07]|nr:histidine kinase [Desulfovibrio sp. OttesenSCG-928-F07]
MIKSLSLKLTIFFTILTLGGVILFTISFRIIFANIYYNRTVTPHTINEVIEHEKTYFTTALQQDDASIWMYVSGDALIKKLKTIPLNGEELLNGDEPYTIDIIVHPDVYLYVTNSSGNVVYTSPESLPEPIAQTFAQQKSEQQIAKNLEQNGHILVSTPLTNVEGEHLGTLTVLFVAEFDSVSFTLASLRGYLDSWYFNLFVCITIALSCSFTANKFVTGPLKRINAATEEWCKGNLSMRINVPVKCDDILAKHSRKLNSVADELEKLMLIKEQSAIEAERNRMASELHDTVKQNLFALNLQLAVIKHKNTTPDITKHITEAEYIVRESQQDVMGILAHLHPAEQEDKTLLCRMEALAEDTGRRYGVKVVWGKKDTKFLSALKNHPLLHMTQEAISNSIRHGKATKITISLFKENNTIFWSVTDNGTGPPPHWNPQQSSGLGLSFMRMRVQEMPNGQFNISAVPEGGMCIAAEWKE